MVPPQFETSVAPPTTEPPPPSRLALAAELASLVLLVVAVHVVRLPSLPLRGEETRRARIAVEMVESGDWLVPRQQGVPLLSRPPLQNWAIALVGMIRGDIDVWAVRLPSAAAVLLTVFVVYFYGLTFLSHAAAFVAAAVFATFGQVLELGSLGETEALFTLFVSGSLLIWHGGRARGWPPLVYWTAAYLCVALGMLTKGPQAPVYFAAAVGVYLLVTRRWREALHWSHLAGIAVFLTVWGAWQWPFYQQLGWAGVREIYGGDVALRFEDNRLVTFLSHLLTFPGEVLLACLFPWSLLLMAFSRRQFRQSLGSRGEQVLFLGLALAVTFPTVWLPPGARGRYYMPMYPCLALLIGLVVDRCRYAPQSSYGPLWRHFLAFVAAGMAATGLAVAFVAGRASMPAAGPFWTFGLPFAAMTFVLAATALWARRGQNSGRLCTGAAAVALFAGLVWNGPVVNAKLAISETSTPDAVVRLKAELPPDARLVSLGPTDHLFAFYYREPIEQIAWPEDPADMGEWRYFCYSTLFSGCPPLEELPVAYEQLAVISCERQRLDAPWRVVVVARRLDGPAVARAVPPRRK